MVEERKGLVDKIVRVYTGRRHQVNENYRIARCSYSLWATHKGVYDLSSIRRMHIMHICMYVARLKQH
jgi:hypothetical protein